MLTEHGDHSYYLFGSLSRSDWVEIDESNGDFWMIIIMSEAKEDVVLSIVCYILA